MADIDPLGEEEKPLDPAMENVRRKMVRLLATSIGIMLAGVMAVLFAVIWRINSDTVPTLATFDLQVPAGFEIRSVSGAETRIAIFGQDEDGTERVLIYDAATGAAVANGRISAGAVAE